jgi:hypothetical protein
MSLMSDLRHSRFTKFARAGLRWAHRVRHHDGKPLHYVVAPGLEFQIYPKGELSQFVSLVPLFEATEMRLVASLLRPGMKVIDAGAILAFILCWPQNGSKAPGTSGLLSLHKTRTDCFWIILL